MKTIREIIDLIDRQKPNAYEDSDKLQWLTKLDKTIFDEIITTHEGGPETFADYTEADMTKEPLGDDVDMYVKWLGAQIDYANQEINRYNNAMIMFNMLYNDYGNRYNRTHMPKGTHFKNLRWDVMR